MDSLRVDVETAKLYCRAQTVPELRSLPISALTQDVVGEAQGRLLRSGWTGATLNRASTWTKEEDYSLFPSMEGVLVHISNKGEGRKQGVITWSRPGLKYPLTLYVPEWGGLAVDPWVQSAVVRFGPEGIYFEDLDSEDIIHSSTDDEYALRIADFQRCRRGKLLLELWARARPDDPRPIWHEQQTFLDAQGQVDQYLARVSMYEDGPQLLKRWADLEYDKGENPRRITHRHTILSFW